MKVKIFVIFFSSLLFSFVTSEKLNSFCSSEIDCNQANSNSGIWLKNENTTKCSSQFDSFPLLQKNVQSVISAHIEASNKFLYLATRFSYWKTERLGFKNLFNSLSDAAFEDALKILQHMSKRGGVLDLVDFKVLGLGEVGESHISEIEALSKALDIQKDLAIRTNHLLHSAISGNRDKNRSPDGEFAHFLAEEIVEKHAGRVSSLAGHVNNLGEAVSAEIKKDKDPAFAVFLYDTQILS